MTPVVVLGACLALIVVGHACARVRPIVHLSKGDPSRAGDWRTEWTEERPIAVLGAFMVYLGGVSLVVALLLFLRDPLFAHWSWQTPVSWLALVLALSFAMRVIRAHLP